MLRNTVLVALVASLGGCGARTGMSDPGLDGGADGMPDATVVAPEVDCWEDEIWTTVGRSAVAYASAVDDGRIVAWHWAVLERPAGSVVQPYPVRAPVTSLTPDGVGDYLLEVTATDDDGLASSCAVTVHSIVGPPVAFCPESIVGATVGRTYALEGDGFDDELVVSFFWEVTARPSGSRAQPEPADQPVTSFTPDLAGRYELTLTVTDNEGLEGSCVVAVVSSGPPRAICPGETTAPTRRPVSLRGDAEDDGTIALWSWELLEAPRRSTARPEPASAQTTTIVPDRVGRYLLRLTVTDDTGLTDSCEAVVNATPTGPEAICPSEVSTTPLTEVVLRGEAVDDGEVVRFRWSLVSSPEASAALPPSPPEGPVATFVPDVAGEYVVRLTVTDDDGMEGACEVLVRAVPGEGLRIELYWNPPDRSCDTRPGPGCDSSDVDLHLLHPSAPAWFHHPLDCHYATCQYDSAEWDTPAPADNPRLDLDDVEGFGPENINIDEPVVGHAYEVGVHYFSRDRWDGPAESYVRIYCGTVSTDPVYEVGPVGLVIRSSGQADFWRVATVVFDGFRCTVTPRVGPGGGPDIITDTEARAHR